MKNKLLIFAFLGLAAKFQAQEFNQDFDATNIHYLLVANIHGDIEISPSFSNTLEVRTSQQYQGDQEDGHPRVTFLQEGDTLALYIESDCHSFSLNKPCKNDQHRWGYYDWEECKKCSALIADFKIKVPSHLTLILSTINDGDIKVSEITTPVRANNINGNIFLKDIEEVTEARTINGDVDLHYRNPPNQSGYFYTLNGNINAHLPEELNADISFKTFQGDFYTNFSSVRTTPVKATQQKEQDGFKYRLGGKANIQINQGGVSLDFETFNGNVYLRTI